MRDSHHSPVFPPAILAQHISLLGKTGAGKSSTGKLIIEQIVASDPHARVCILDPIKSDWWGLTSSADGKRPGLPFHILGGPRGHVPLHPSSGKAIGELVGTGMLPLSIIDMADFPPGGLQEFFNDFAPTLLRKMRGVVHLVIEEAHEFAPKDRAGFGGENMTLHFAKKLATAGRSKGIRMMVMTQRTQALHNAVLGSCDTMIAHRLTAPADQEPVKKWLKANVDKATFEKVADSLASLKTGTGWLCSGEAQIAELRTFPKIATFDNSATPSSGDGEHHVTTAPVDQEKLRAIIGEAVEQAKADDPKALRAEIARLQGELAKKPAGTPVVDTVAIEAARHEGWLAANKLAAANMADLLQRVVETGELIDRFKVGHEAGMPEYTEVYRTRSPGITHARQPFIPAPSTVPTVSTSQPAKVSTKQAVDGALKPALQRVVNAIGWWRQIGQDPVDRARACVVASLSPKASTFGVYIGELIKLGLVESSPGKVGLTPDGLALAVVPAGDTREQIHDVARSLLAPQEQRVFDAIYAVYPNEIARVDLAHAVGLSPTASTLGVYIGGIAAYGIIENGSRGHVRAARWLFP